MSWILRSPEAEQRALTSAAADEIRQMSNRAVASRAQAEHVTRTRKSYPWLPASMALALAKINAAADQVDEVARSTASARTEPKPKKKSFWARAGDVVSFVPRQGADFVSNVADVITPEKAEKVIGSAVRGATRNTLSAFQAVPEAVDYRVRDQVRTFREEGVVGGVLDLLTNPPTAGNVDYEEQARNTTVGAALLERGPDGERLSMGDGFFPMGTAGVRQSENARQIATVNGSAATVGRLAANVVFEPGSKPYSIMSGLIDATMDFYSPENLAASAATKSAKVAKVFADDVSEAAVVKASKKAPAAWREEVEQAAGMVNGTRSTVIPASVDKWLFSNEARKVVGKIAATSSPTAIWRALGKKIDPDLAKALADAPDEASVLAVLRPALGVDLVKPSIGRLSDNLGPLGVRVVNTAQAKVRAFNLRPETFLDFDDPTSLIRNLDNTLANAHVMGSKRDALLDRAFELVSRNDPTSRFELTDLAKDAVKESLVGHGIAPVMAERLTSWDGGFGRVSKFTDDDLGNDVNLSFLVDEDGVPMNRPIPSALVELMSRGVPIHAQDKVREVRDLTTRLRHVEQLTAFKAPHSAVNFVQQELWKPSAIMRLAYFARVNTEEVLRSWVSGSFDSVVDWIRFAANRTGTKDASGNLFNLTKEADALTERLAKVADDDVAAETIKGRLAQINDEILDNANEFHRSQVGKYWKHDSLESVERQLHRTGSWQTADKVAQPEAWATGIGDSIIQFSKDPILRRVANGGLFDGDKAANARAGLDGIKDWLRDGTGVKFRQKLERALEASTGSAVDLTEHLDELIAHYVNKIRWKVGDQEDLAQAIATGTFNGKPIAVKAKGKVKGRAGLHDVSSELKERIAAFRDDPSAPRKAKFEQRLAVSESLGGRAAGEFLEHRDRLVTFFFGNLYGKTSDYLARSPLFRAKYWSRMEELMPWMDDASRRQAITNARKQKLGKARIERLQEMTKRPAGELSLDDADGHAKGYGLDETQKTLYSANEASQFFDITRAIFPFGEAFKEVTTRWAKTLSTKPAVTNRGAQAITGARESGFFYRDPVTAEEVFNYPIPPALADWIGVEWKGSAMGLSLGTQVIPGLSPVASMFASRLIPDVPEADWIASLIFPFGEPDTSSPGAALETMAPPWMKKAFEAWSASEDKNRIYGNTYVEVVRVLVASGDYGASVDERERLYEDARTKARIITGMRALLQFIVPSAPSPNYLVEVEGGDRVSGLLAKRFGKLLETREYPDAVEGFINEFGQQAFVYLSGKTKPTVGGLSSSPEFGRWERKNADLFDKYPRVAGYFGPTSEGYDPSVFSRQERTGRRVRQSARDLVADAENTVARWVWNNKRAEVGPKPTKAQKAWLDQVKSDLQEDYPGWNAAAFPAGEREAAVRQLADAADDPKIKKTPVGEALGIYFAKRAEARDAAKAQFGLSTHLSGKKARHLRDWMRSIAADLAEDFPGFARVYEEVLDGEMKDDAAADADEQENTG